MVGAVLPKLVGHIFYIPRNTKQPERRTCFVPFLESAMRRLAPGGRLLILTHLIIVISKHQLCQEQQTLPVRLNRAHVLLLALLEHKASRGELGEQRGEAAINPSGNASSLIQDEHPIDFHSLKSYLGNRLVRCGVTTM